MDQLHLKPMAVFQALASSGQFALHRRPQQAACVSTTDYARDGLGRRTLAKARVISRPVTMTHMP